VRAMERVTWLGPVLVRLEMGPPTSSHSVTVAEVVLPAAVGGRGGAFSPSEDACEACWRG
jgi:hypothetical protein